MTSPLPAETNAADAISSMPPLRFVLSRSDLRRLIMQDPSVHENFVFAEIFVRGFYRPAIIAFTAWLSTSATMLGLRGIDGGIYLFAMGLVFFLPYVLLYAVLWRWLANKYAAHGFAQPREIEFTADGLVYREGPREAHIPWGAVRGATDLRDALVLHLNLWPDIAIPNRAFARDGQRRLLLYILRHDFAVPIETPEPRAPSHSAFFPWEQRAHQLKWVAIGGFCLFIGAMYLIIVWS